MRAFLGGSCALLALSGCAAGASGAGFEESRPASAVVDAGPEPEAGTPVRADGGARSPVRRDAGPTPTDAAPVVDAPAGPGDEARACGVQGGENPYCLHAGGTLPTTRPPP